MRIDVWADVVCPWCALGHHRLATALRSTGVQAEVVHRAFELDPAHGPSRPAPEALRGKYGDRAAGMMRHVRELAAAEGLVLRTEQAVSARTFDAHRLVLWAQARGQGPAMLDRLFAAHFAQGRDVAEAGTLVALAAEVGLAADDARAMLRSDAWRAEVRGDEDLARRLGITGVPFFVVDGRLALSGAQPLAAFEQLLRQAAVT